MNKKKLLGFTKFLINAYKTGLTSTNVAKSLKDSITYRSIGTIVEREIVENRVPLYLALRKHNLVPSHYSYLLEAGEKSGKIVEILNSYYQILENQIKIDEELKGYRMYFVFVNILIIFGVLLFYFIFNNVFLKIVEDRTTETFIFFQFIKDLLNPMNVFIFLLIIVMIAVLLSFRNFILDIFEYYILGRPYREIVFSQIMGIWGNLISAGIPIPLSLYIAVSTIENNTFRSALNSFLYKITEGYKEVNYDIVSKIFDIFPSDYRLILKNAFSTGILDQELIDTSREVYENSSKSLKARVTLIMITLIGLALIILGGLILISFLSIYLAIFEELK